jgi:hypothetical protein
MSDPEHARQPRFPWVALALALASVAGAVWLWMEYSYAWHAAPTDLWVRERPRGFGGKDPPGLMWTAERWEPIYPNSWLAGKYVRLRSSGLVVAGTRQPVRETVWLKPRHRSFRPNRTTLNHDAVLEGRVVWVSPYGSREYLQLGLDTTAGRLTGASVAGLVVGAWGVFIFAAAFLHWRSRRGVCPPGCRTKGVVGRA